MFASYDPCAHCHKDIDQRKKCQGTPFAPGPCPSAEEHWHYISDRLMNGYARSSYDKQLRQETRNIGRKRGWK